MTTSTTSASGGSFGVVTILAVLLGAAIVGYGLLLAPQSLIGGAWIAAVGLSLLLSGMFATEWAGDRFGLSAVDRRRLSLAFAGLAAFLLVAFVVVNFASFESAEIEGGTR
ncbi:hypothetical protein [Halomarina pelagica]|uniref:hypothetical protein n=1 Tax=Halomarina pelagica TaxID=2961599 RepID=UPI0020C5963B|nr:hypothetical protein [Halomarina sp. BND7]